MLVSDKGSVWLSESSARVREAALLEMQDAPPPPSESRTGVSGLLDINRSARASRQRTLQFLAWVNFGRPSVSARSAAGDRPRGNAQIRNAGA